MILSSAGPVPSLIWVVPFAALLLCIAILPLIHRTEHWWEQNRSKLIVGLALGLVTLGYYATRDFGVRVHDETVVHLFERIGLPMHEHEGHHVADAGVATAAGALANAIMEYLPFIVLLFSLYTICGGIAVRGDIPAHPMTNTVFLAVGGVIASVVGTTGASMLLIRPLLQTNSERRHVAHTVIFFIFIVSNIGGCLLPIGDPPLFLGYLRSVPFLWTLQLWKAWAFTVGILLVVYYVWDTIAYRREAPQEIRRDETQLEPMQVAGKINFLWLLLVVSAVGLLDPSKPVVGTDFTPPPFMREGVLLALVVISWFTTPGGLREGNKFNFTAIGEVACLFIGIFITMQVPIEILNAQGAELGLKKPWQFFWATGMLSSFLDNAPTYVVFFETANALTHQAGPGILSLLDGNFMRTDLLVGISLGAVFMGANTYIGNGPNFMVKSIAEQSGVRMPSFFGYMLYSGLILIPIFVLVTFFFVI